MGSFLYASTHSLTAFNKLLLSKARPLLPDLPESSYYSLLMFYLFLFLTIFNLIFLKKPPNYFLNISSISLYIFLALRHLLLDLLTLLWFSVWQNIFPFHFEWIFPRFLMFTLSLHLYTVFPHRWEQTFLLICLTHCQLKCTFSGHILPLVIIDYSSTISYSWLLIIEAVIQCFPNSLLILPCVLSLFSWVQLFLTIWTRARQALLCSFPLKSLMNHAKEV